LQAAATSVIVISVSDADAEARCLGFDPVGMRVGVPLAGVQMVWVTVIERMVLDRPAHYHLARTTTNLYVP